MWLRTSLLSQRMWSSQRTSGLCEHLLHPCEPISYKFCKLKCEPGSFEFLTRLWRSRPRSLEFWLIIFSVGLTYLILFRNLFHWTWTTKTLNYIHSFYKRPLASPYYLHFMSRICLMAFLSWSLRNLSPEVQFSTAACHMGRGGLQLWVSKFIPLYYTSEVFSLAKQSA